jgi:integrase
MPKVARPLTAIEVKRLVEPGLHAVGTVPGLCLRVADPPSTSRNWVLRIVVGNKRRDMGLGGYPAVPLAQAHEIARQKRLAVDEGLDPVEQRRAAKRALRASDASRMTFEEASKGYIEANEPAWKNAKHAWQWRNSLELYAWPKIAKLEIQHVGMAQVLEVLEPIWRTKTETASRIRGRIELIIAWADKRLEIERLNPARWRGHLDTQLPAPGKVARTKHHPALPVSEVSSFFRSLRTQEGNSALALEFAILTAARSGEVRGATWDEIDAHSMVWTIPGERMKGGREHRVPLSEAAVNVLQVAPRFAESSIVFQSPRGGKLSDMALVAVCRRMGADCVPHGFRSTFRDWCAERANVGREIAEMAPAHAIENEVEAAYRRGDVFDKRRELMNNWASFLQSGKTRNS